MHYGRNFKVKYAGKAKKTMVSKRILLDALYPNIFYMPHLVLEGRFQDSKLSTLCDSQMPRITES